MKHTVVLDVKKGMFTLLLCIEFNIETMLKDRETSILKLSEIDTAGWHPLGPSKHSSTREDIMLHLKYRWRVWCKSLHGWILQLIEKHGQGTHNTKMGADKLVENTPNAPIFFAKFVCSSPKVWDF
jgi:hypothetical protein